MSALTDYAEDLVLSWLLTTATPTRPTTWFVALHKGDPGETGANAEVAGGDDADYVRKAVTFDAPSAGQSASSTEVTWTVAAASGGYTVTHASVWTESTGGNCLIKGQLIASRTLAPNGVLTFSIGEIVASAD